MNKYYNPNEKQEIVVRNLDVNSTSMSVEVLKMLVTLTVAIAVLSYFGLV